ncbi:hypothetical protein BJX96DRAFT_156989 [Aspergillus floccosus]
MVNQEINHGAWNTHRALTNPLILERIFTWISRDERRSWPDPERLRNLREEDPDYSDNDNQHYFNANGVLVRCTQVSRQWHYEAARLFWRDWDYNFYRLWECSFVTVFERIKPARRQFYAELIHHVGVHAIEREDSIQSVTEIFDGLCFSNLESLTLLIPGSSLDRVEIPIFHAPKLRTLLFDPHYECQPEMYGVCQEEWKVLFDLVTVRFPNVENISFLDNAKVWPGEIQKLQDRLPRLKQFDVAGVVESTQAW